MSHVHEKIDFTVTAFMVHDNKVLLRLHDKYNQWFGIGGHIELDEDPVEALTHEIKEETGLEFKLLAPPVHVFSDGSVNIPSPAFINRHHTSDNHEHIDMIYVARALTTEIQPAPDEMSNPENFRWFSEKDLINPENNVIPRTQYHAGQALKIAQSYE